MQGAGMEDTAQRNPQHHIDLTRTMEAAYWCRVFDVSFDQLRDAVHHAGHQVPEVRRYLAAKLARSSLAPGA
jgi:hypothetical protein